MVDDDLVKQGACTAGNYVHYAFIRYGDFFRNIIIQIQGFTGVGY